MNTYVPVDFSSDSAADDVDSYVKSDDVIDRNDDDAELYDGHPKVCGIENLWKRWMLVHKLDMDTSDSLIASWDRRKTYTRHEYIWYSNNIME